MSEELFDVVFFGILQPGKDKETVMQNMAALFKTDAAKLTPYFAGGRVAEILHGGPPDLLHGSTGLVRNDPVRAGGPHHGGLYRCTTRKRAGSGHAHAHGLPRKRL